MFRLSSTLKEDIQPKLLKQALSETLEEFDSFKVKLRRGFFWNYFELNNREPFIEEESTYPCKFIDPHSSHMYLFRVTYYKKRINLEVFHALTDGMGAVHFIRRLTERYLKLAEPLTESMPVLTEPEESFQEEDNRDYSRKEDGYLKYYKKKPHRRYATNRAMEIRGEVLPLDSQSVVQGAVEVSALKALCAEKGVSITKYLTAMLIWSLIQVYAGDGELERAVAVSLPINLRTFFNSDTMANFFAVVNIGWPAGRRPDSFDELLAETGRQMDEKIEKNRLEEIISYNVSNEKKWYVRIMPLFVKRLAMNAIFARSSRAYTMTFSNLGIVDMEPETAGRVEQYQAIIGASARQKIKCSVIAFDGRLFMTFNSALNDTKLSDAFFGLLRERGLEAELESNGVVDGEHNKGTYPEVSYDRGFLKKMVNIFYLILFTAAFVTWAVNLATYRYMQHWWSVVAIGGIAYVAVTLRYSIMRRATLAGILVVESLGAQALLVLIDYMTGFYGWSFDYAIPSVILFDIIAAVFLILVNRMNWQSYFMYQIAITIFSFIPLIFWAAGLVKRPLMSLITVVLCVSVMMVTVIMGDRSVKNELKRRFHL